MWQITVTRSFPAHTVTVQSGDRSLSDTTDYQVADALARSVWPEARLSHKGTTALGYAVRTYTGAPAHHRRRMARNTQRVSTQLSET